MATATGEPQRRPAPFELSLHDRLRSFVSKVRGPHTPGQHFSQTLLVVGDVRGLVSVCISISCVKEQDASKASMHVNGGQVNDCIGHAA
jgi:hypothetical protein